MIFKDLFLTCWDMYLNTPVKVHIFDENCQEVKTEYFDAGVLYSSQYGEWFVSRFEIKVRGSLTRMDVMFDISIYPTLN